jgi:hypothetical protein
MVLEPPAPAPLPSMRPSPTVLSAVVPRRTGVKIEDAAAPPPPAPPVRSEFIARVTSAQPGVAEPPSHRLPPMRVPSPTGTASSVDSMGVLVAGSTVSADGSSTTGWSRGDDRSSRRLPSVLSTGRSVSPPSSPDEGRRIMAPMQMSCNAAARIIADMNVHDDADHIRGALGCHGRRECVIKNTTLLQVMDNP